jgi:peptide/nickel transport system ATP-binding protein
LVLSCRPRILIADEPTTALDVTIEAEIIDLIKVLQEDLGMAVIFITHNLGVIARIAHRIMVMYSGKAVEIGTTQQILNNPAHPYTKGLLQSIPQIGRRDRLHTIPGTVPNPFGLPKGCYFAPRCKWAMERCADYPPSFALEDGHQTQCWLYEDTKEGPDDEHTPAGNPS